MITPAEVRAANILIVDDLEANVLLLEGMLKNAGYSRVARMLDPRQVCELHRQHRYDLILLDLQMPEMDGFEVMESLRQVETDGFLPVLVITAEPAHKLRALKAGARDFITKPFALSEVLMRVQNLAEVSLLHKKLVSYAAQLELRNQLLEEQLLAAKHLSTEVEAANRALAAANQTLDEFAYATSHDLKVPLRGIMNLTGWIAEDLGELAMPTVKENLALIHKRAKRLEALIDGILAYARAGHLFAKPEQLDTKTLIKEVVELLDPPANVRIELLDSLPCLVAERVPLQQIFMNLIQNAMKHGCRDGGCVKVSSREEAELYCFSVGDSGPGIAPEYHQRIFAIFEKLVAQDKVEGSGIGLSVVKKLVESRGGTATVSSVPGTGATFSFTWPRAPLALQPQRLVAPVPTTPST